MEALKEWYAFEVHWCGVCLSHPGRMVLNIIFPLHPEEIKVHANQRMLVDIAFRSNRDIEIHSFDPMAMAFFDLHHFKICVFRWATFVGVRPISMIGGYLPQRGYDLQHDFKAWLFDAVEIEETVTAIS